MKTPSLCLNIEYRRAKADTTDNACMVVNKHFPFLRGLTCSIHPAFLHGDSCHIQTDQNNKNLSQ